MDRRLSLVMLQSYQWHSIWYTQTDAPHHLAGSYQRLFFVRNISCLETIIRHTSFSSSSVCLIDSKTLSKVIIAVYILFGSLIICPLAQKFSHAFDQPLTLWLQMNYSDYYPIDGTLYSRQNGIVIIPWIRDKTEFSRQK